MNVAFHTRMAAAALLFTLLFQGQSRSQSQKPDQSRQSASSKSSSQPVGESTPRQVTSPQTQTTGQIVAPVASGNSMTSEPKESFSQLTLFLFASGLGLFIALLGWSDQIRGIDKDTRELEERFLKKTEINKTHFVEIVKSGEPEKQLLALTQAINDGKIMSNVSVKVLESFDEYVTKLRALERLSDRKYKTTIALTIVLFVSGTVSLFTNPTQALLSIRVEMIILIVPMILIGVLLVIIIRSAAKEKVLRSLLSSMSDMV